MHMNSAEHVHVQHVNVHVHVHIVHMFSRFHAVLI